MDNKQHIEFLKILKKKKIFIAKQGKLILNNNWKKLVSNQKDKSIQKLLEAYRTKLNLESITKELFYCILHNIASRPKCVTCNKRYTKFINFNRGYLKHCSPQCAQLDKETKEKYWNTIKKRYGDKLLKNEKIIEKKKQTFLKKYGVDHHWKNKDIRQKTIDTFLKKYGVDNPTKCEEIKKKIKQTNKSKYDVEAQSQRHLPKEVIKKLQDVDFLYTEHFVNKKTLSQIGKELGVAYTTIADRLKKCGYQPVLHNISDVEKQLREFIIKELQITDVIFNSRKIIPPYEIDIFVPQYNIGIELNGVVWHSEHIGGKDKDYHVTKYTKAKESNITLLQFWDTEWIHSNNIVKSIIKYYFDKIENRLHGRKCSVIQLKDIRIINQFLKENHLQGEVRLTNKHVTLGLVHKKELVSLIIFDKPRFNKNYQWEIIRFATKVDTTIRGGFSKLMLYFIEKYNPNSIISYLDLRYSSGKSYKVFPGFKIVGQTKPGYYYFYRSESTYPQLLSRIKFQKHKLGYILESFDPKKSEWENMINNGYDRVWDCGHMVWVWSKDNFDK